MIGMTFVAFATEFIPDRDIMTTDKPRRGKWKNESH